MYIPEVMKTGSANVNFLCNFSQLLQSNIRLFMKVKSDHRSKFSNLSNWKEETWKKIRALTAFEPVTSANTGAKLYQLSYEATNWERGQFIEFISSRAVKWCEVLYLYCGCRWKWRVIIAVNFQFKQLENWKKIFFAGFFFPITAMITLHFHLQPQNKYELFQIKLHISLFTVLFTADDRFFFFFDCFLVRDLCRSGCRHSYHPPTPRPAPMFLFFTHNPLFNTSDSYLKSVRA